MTTTCERLDDLLYEGDDASLATAEQHAQGCAACRAVLDAWNEIGATARTMQHSWESDVVLPRALRTIRAERTGGARYWQIAAVLVIAALLGGSLTWVLSRRASETEFDQSILRMSAVEEVERAEQSHLAAIRQLESAAAPKLRDAESPLMASYNEKLMLLDDAIAECEAAIERNRQNAYLRRQLLTALNEKRTTLQQVMREETNVPAN